MTSKRQRRRARSRAGPRNQPSEAQARVEEAEPIAKGSPSRAEAARDTPVPALAPSVAAGLRAVGSSPEILAVVFLSVLLTWGTFVLLGTEPSGGTLSLLFTVPPVEVVFGDGAVVLLPGQSGQATVIAIAGLAIVRGLTYALVTMLVVQVLRDGTASVRQAFVALPRAGLVFAGLYLAHFGMTVAAALLVQQYLPQLSVLVIPAGLYFLAYSPVVAAAEGDGPRQAIRRGVRAARLPGTRHLTLGFAYFVFVFFSGSIAPFGPLPPATPSIGAWAYGLGATFVHVSVLAAFAFRWLEVREHVPEVARRRGAAS